MFLEEETEEIEIDVQTVGGPKAGEFCVFPFKFNGVPQLSCIEDTEEKKSWCSTLVDDDGEHVGGSNNWGYCPTCTN